MQAIHGADDAPAPGSTADQGQDDLQIKVDLIFCLGLFLTIFIYRKSMTYVIMLEFEQPIDFGTLKKRKRSQI